MTQPQQTKQTSATGTSAVMGAVFIATFMTSVETTVVTTSMPSIISDLKGLSLQSWVFAVYLLTMAVTTPLHGKLSDRMGRKPVFVVGLCFFAIGSLLCALAPSMGMLIAARAVQGIGAGAVTPTTFTIIADLVPYERRARILAFNNTAWGISALLGPLIGGFLVDQLSWHWVFLINVPLSGLVLALVLLAYHEPAPAKASSHLDLGGMLALSASLLALLLGLQTLSGGRPQWAWPAILLAAFLACMFAFARIERKAADPLIPPTLFANRTFSMQIVSALLVSGAQIGFQVYLPIWLQSIYQASPSLAGWAVTPSPVMWLAASFLVGPLLKRWAPKRIIMACAALMLIAYLPLAISIRNLPMASFYIIAAITGIGLGITITTNTMIAQHVVPKNSVGTASSMLTLGRTLGQAVMTGIYGLAFNKAIASGIAAHPHIDLAAVNQFISSTASHAIPRQLRTQLEAITLPALHAVMIIVALLFAITLILNTFDRQNTTIK